MILIQSLEDLKKLIGDDAVDRIFTEYFMELIAKKQAADEVVNIIKRKGTLAEIEAIL